MLEVKNLSCHKGHNLLFSKLTFYMKAGDIAKINGANGKGKTSLLRIIAGLANFEGMVKLFNYDPQHKKYKEQLLYLGHQSLIHPLLTIKENLKFLLYLSDNSINQNYEKALNSVGLANNYDELCYKLSAGQKRRVVLAALFLTKTKVWLLDEPFNTLDATMVKIIENKIIDFCNAGGICIFTTHQKTTLKAKQINL